MSTVITDMTILEVPVDDRWLLSTGMTPAEAKQELRVILSAKLYELSKVTLAQGAEIAGLPVVAYVEALSRLGVSVINYSPEELADELRRA